MTNSLPIEVESLIKSVTEKEGILKYETSDVVFNQKGEGFLGDVCLVSVTDKNSAKKLHLVIKCSFRQEQMRAALPIRNAFENEIYFYSTIYPALTKLSPSSKNLVPKVFKVTLNDNEEALVMDNLRHHGFVTIDKKAELCGDHIKLIFKTYGKFHALSYALKDQDPEKYHKLGDGIIPVFIKFLDAPTFYKAIEGICKMAETYLDPKEDKDALAKFKKYVDNPVKIFGDCLTTEGKHFAITHGDCWSNNMMFKYEKLNNQSTGRPIDIRLIDFQLAKVGSPVCDLSYCLYSGASKKELNKLDEYLKVYHDSLSSTLKELGSSPEDLFPFSELKKHWKYYSRFGMLMSFLVLKVKLTDKGEVKDLTDEVMGGSQDGSSLLTASGDDETFRRRVRDMILHMNEVGAL